MRRMLCFAIRRQADASRRKQTPRDSWLNELVDFQEFFVGGITNGKFLYEI